MTDSFLGSFDTEDDPQSAFLKLFGAGASPEDAQNAVQEHFQMSFLPPDVSEPSVLTHHVNPKTDKFLAPVPTTTTENPRDAYEAGLQSNLESETKTYLEKAAESKAPLKLSGTQALSSGLAPILGLLIGAAVAGRKGALVGGEAGSKGGLFGLALAQEEAKKKQELAAIESKQAYDAMKDTRSDISKSEQARLKLGEQHDRDLFLEGGKDRRAEEYKQGRGSMYERLLGLEGAKEYAQAQVQNLKDTSEQKNALPQPVQDEISGNKAKIRGYTRLAQYFATTPIDPKDFEKAADSFSSTIEEAGRKNDFDISLIDRSLSKAGLNPNSPAGQYLREAAMIGRAVAIAQRGTATNQDVAQEVGNISIGILEDPNKYLGRLNREVVSQKRQIEDRLNDQILQNRSSAKTLLEEYRKQGFVLNDEDKNARKAARTAEILARKLKEAGLQ